MARWERAVNLMGQPRGARVLDVGCAFGYGTAKLARRYRVEGIDPSARYIERARRQYPQLSFRTGSAVELPYADGQFDGVVMLDVLEHLPTGDQEQALDELARVLRPGGSLVLSTPNKGLLAWADSLNLYLTLCGTDPRLVATFALQGDPPRHRHYSVADLRRLLARHGLLVELVVYSGAGLVELINVMLLLLVWRPRPLRPLYTLLQYIYYGGYIAEDNLSLGQFSYHVMVVARRQSG